MTESASDVHRRTVDLVNQGRAAEALELIDPAVIDHRGGVTGDHHGLAEWRDKWAHMYDGFAGVSARIERNLSDGEYSTNRYTLRGKHIESGRSYEITGIDMVRVRNGKIVEHWAVPDTTAMRHQLGI